ncbi:MAG: hypothetical protein H2038_06730 [Brevundimonas sp.]|jgi:hypothetical protein|uniref:hypothetical protein n=1 Tax=Brevundimonas sp. TaxID=1871086 RepID=UPI0017F43C28|nr:hypothetical protein [Brevundimonas sp.]MBA4804327.1 hypothetical protein [Brevundimonas sp.]
MPAAEPPRLLLVRCLAPGCFHEALLDAKVLFPAGDRPPPGRSDRFRCRCGARRAMLEYVRRRPRPANPCGWI